MTRSTAYKVKSSPNSCFTAAAHSASDYFIFIESDKAIESVYCRDEWAKAIQLAKPIIPALTTGNFDNLPKEGNIYLHDSPNFSKQENFASALRKLLVNPAEGTSRLALKAPHTIDGVPSTRMSIHAKSC